MSEFILMLTRNDETISDALDVFGQLRGSLVRYVGFKDVGLPAEQLEDLAKEIHRAGKQVLLEIVSTSREAELRSVRMAIRLEVDYVLGGIHPHDVLPLLRGTRFRYFPFAGEVTGHPNVLVGSLEDIAASAASLGSLEGVHGFDLLAYRFKGDTAALLTAVRRMTELPIIVAGSIDSEQRLEEVVRSGAWGFTIGTAILDGKFPNGVESLAERANWVVRRAWELRQSAQVADTDWS